jgi:predicted CopG family antitoxin
MGTKSVRLDEEVYERIKAHKRDDETFSEVIDRLTSEYSLLEFAGGYSEAEAERHRALLEEAETAGTTARDERLARLDIDTE